MRILLINSNLKQDMLAAPPIGICYVAAATAMAGHEVKVLDLCFHRDILKAIRTDIRSFSPDVVGISIRNLDNGNLLCPRPFLSDIEKIVQGTRDSTLAPIVVGGSAASLTPGPLLKRLGADFIVVSEGEHAFPALLEAIRKGDSPKGIPGVGVIEDNEFNLTPPDLKEFPPYKPETGSWLDLKPYWKIGGTYNIQTKRGCRQHCIYCVYNELLEGGRQRLRNAVDVVDEIEEALLKYEPGTIEFVDSVFNDPLDYCSEILEEIVRRPWKARFTAMGIRPIGLDEKFLRLLDKAGFTSIWISPDSASETMIRNYRKGFTADDVILAAEAINDSRFTSVWSFLIGGPGETHQTLQESLDFTLKYLKRDSHPPLHITNYVLGVRVFPRTPMWDIALQEGLIRDQSDPLDSLFYVSEKLDLDLVLEQIHRTWLECPEITCGYDERFLTVFPRGVVFVARLFGDDQLHWRAIYHANRFLKRTRLIRLAPLPKADWIRTHLERQGYRGRLVKY